MTYEKKCWRAYNNLSAVLQDVMVLHHSKFKDRDEHKALVLEAMSAIARLIDSIDD